MKFILKRLNISAGRPIAFIHERDAHSLALRAGDRVTIHTNGKSEVAIADVISTFLKKGELGLSQEIASYLNVVKGSLVSVERSKKAHGSEFLEGRIRCAPYTKSQLKQIIRDIVTNALTEAEIAYFISGVNYCGMSLDETQYLIESIVETGKRIDWGAAQVADKHSIGGIPGNRTTPIVVALCASAGITIPKTSSRAITSAAGTADSVECIAPVNFPLAELKKVVKKTGACLAWGGALGLAPADDKLIRVEKMLNLDPEPQLIASILAKKIAVGSTHILIDIPYGAGAKVTRKEAIELKQKFLEFGKRLGRVIRVVLTDGKQPIGNGIGPMLEIKDIIKVLAREKDAPLDLEKKSVMLAGNLIEMMNKAPVGKGKAKAQELLDSGKAFKKFKEIILAQGGSLDRLKEAKFKRDFVSTRSGVITRIHNKAVNRTANILGCPQDKAAGIYLEHHIGKQVKKGEKLAIFYSESRSKLSEGFAYAKQQPFIELE